MAGEPDPPAPNGGNSCALASWRRSMSTISALSAASELSLNTPNAQWHGSVRQPRLTTRISLYPEPPVTVTPTTMNVGDAACAASDAMRTTSDIDSVLRAVIRGR